MIEALDLLAEDKVLQQGGTAFTSAQTVLVLNGAAHVGSEVSVIVIEVVLREKFLSGF